jgi:transcriptional regulator with XRE-family HTH domain
MDIKQMIGARIKEIRTKRGITQERLSERMEINPKYLSGIERGKENPTLNTLIKLSESLQVDIGEIFSSVEAEDPHRSKSQILSLLDEADSEQLKLIFRVLSVVIH